MPTDAIKQDQVVYASLWQTRMMEELGAQARLPCAIGTHAHMSHLFEDELLLSVLPRYINTAQLTQMCRHERSDEFLLRYADLEGRMAVECGKLVG